MSSQPFDFDRQTVTEWRELGFYYDLNGTQWRFYGSKRGLQNVVWLLDAYTNNPDKTGLSEHSHWGPYNYLKIMTWSKPTLSPGYLAGTIPDLSALRDVIAEKLANAQPGQSFRIDEDYSVDNEATAQFFVMADEFDPPSLDTNCARLLNTLL